MRLFDGNAEGLCPNVICAPIERQLSWLIRPITTALHRARAARLEHRRATGFERRAPRIHLRDHLSNSPQSPLVWTCYPSLGLL